jgi:cell division GTPase FtsZ
MALYDLELIRTVAQMMAARIGPSFDLDDVRITLGENLAAISMAQATAHGPSTALAVEAAIGALVEIGDETKQVRGMLACVATGIGLNPLAAVKSAAYLLRLGVQPNVPVICGAIVDPMIVDFVTITLWTNRPTTVVGPR